MSVKDVSRKINNPEFSRHAGFSLVELLVVLVIAVTVISVTTVAYNKLSTNAYLKNSARHVAASLRYARNYAVAKGVDAQMQIDLNRRTYRYSGNNGSFAFRPGINLEVYSADFPNQSPGIVAIYFAPDGSSSGGRVTLSSRNKSYVVHVDWLTGRVGIDG